MSGRLPTHLTVGALLRRVNDAGGLAMVRAKGDPHAGTVLVIVEDGQHSAILERGPGGGAFAESKRYNQGDAELDDYWRRRRARDPDLWVIELSIPSAERFVAETMP